jgi:Leucine-rich repeat (LRR) protein
MTKHLFSFAAAFLLLGAGCVASPALPSDPASPDAPSREAPAPVAGRLDLSGRGLTALPASVLDREELVELDISGNRIGGALPAEIGRLSGLRVLDASGNRMTGVPAEIGRLAQLRLLDLSDNALTGLPHELADLKRLETLDLRGNDVSASDLGVIRAGIPQARILID